MGVCFKNQEIREGWKSKKFHHLYRSLGVICLFWILLPAVLISFPCEELESFLHIPASFNSMSSDTATGKFGKFEYAAWDAEKDYRPLYLIRFDELTTENGQLGIFKTGIYRTAKIKGLRLRLFEYSFDPATQTDKKQVLPQSGLPGAVKVATRKKMPEVSSDIGRHLGSLTKQVAINNLDLSDVGELRIRDFDYGFFDNDAMVVGIKSTLANVSYRSKEIILRGHVTITASNGDTLQSNHVCWDSRTESFVVKGSYILNSHGNRVIGSGISVDVQLNDIHKQQANVNTREMEKCLTRM